MRIERVKYTSAARRWVKVYYDTGLILDVDLHSPGEDSDGMAEFLATPGNKIEDKIEEAPQQ